MTKNVHAEHRMRVRKKFLEHGPESFEPHKMLELLLFFAIPQIDTNEIAHRLIDEFGSLANVFDARYQDLVKVNGIGNISATLIKLIPALCTAYLDSKSSPSNNEIIDSTSKAGKYFVPKFLGSREELVYLLCLDGRRKPINCKLLHRGSINTAHISMRRIAETALLYNASSCIVSHNHPGGLAVPSKDDISTTQAIKTTLNAVDVILQDHIIVGDSGEDDYISLADSNLI